MNKFTHIGSYHQVAKYIRELNESYSVPPDKKIKTPVTFRGTIKLHGTNAGVAFIGDEIKFQSRNRRLTSRNDNAGFAAFGESRVDVLARLKDMITSGITILEDEHLIVFGEWCGPGIQRSVAINNLPERQFVIFSVAIVKNDGELEYLDFDLATSFIYKEDLEFLNSASIYLVSQVPGYTITVDFNSEVSYRTASETIEKLTLEVEEQCSWAAKFGIKGTGEGIVWVPVSSIHFSTCDHIGNSDLFFKSKGRKHQDKAAKNLVPIDFEKIAGAEAFIEFILTERRLEQGIEFLEENNIALDVKSTGKFLKWINDDCLREGADTLESNNVEWKDVVKRLSTKAREWFFERIQNG